MAIRETNTRDEEIVSASLGMANITEQLSKLTRHSKKGIGIGA